MEKRRAIASLKRCGVYQDVVVAVQRIVIQTVVDSCNGNHHQASRILGLSRFTMRKYIGGARQASDPTAKSPEGGEVSDP